MIKKVIFNNSNPWDSSNDDNSNKVKFVDFSKMTRMQDAVDELCDLQVSKVRELKNHSPNEVSEDVLEFTNSVVSKIKGYEKAMEEQHKEFLSLLK